MKKIQPEFFTQNPIDCARQLIGCDFQWDGCSGRIVETEAYHAVGDEACHTWLRPSSRKYIEEHQAGDTYIYLTYGMYWLLNILVKGKAGNGFVLIRALEPDRGIERMFERRGVEKEHQLTSGPGKLTIAFGIDKKDHGQPFLQKSGRGIIHGTSEKIIAGPRIGISKAMDLPWRFGDPDSKHLSKKF